MQVKKIPGEQNPADLMTKVLVLSLKEVVDRLSWMNLREEVQEEYSERGEEWR